MYINERGLLKCMTSELITGLGIVIGRNVIGWLINSLKDGEIQKYEIAQGVKSLVVLFGVSIGLYYGLPEENFIELTGLVASGDLILSEVKKAFKK